MVNELTLAASQGRRVVPGRRGANQGNSDDGAFVSGLCARDGPKSFTR